jgi:hypothetical protein
MTVDPILPSSASITAVASPTSLPAQPARRGERMLSELASLITTTLPLIPAMTFLL